MGSWAKGSKSHVDVGDDYSGREMEAWEKQVNNDANERSAAWGLQSGVGVN